MGTKKPPGLVHAENITSSHRVFKAPYTHTNKFVTGSVIIAHFPSDFKSNIKILWKFLHITPYKSGMVDDERVLSVGIT